MLISAYFCSLLLLLKRNERGCHIQPGPRFTEYSEDAQSPATQFLLKETLIHDVNFGLDDPTLQSWSGLAAPREATRGGKAAAVSTE